MLRTIFTIGLLALLGLVALNLVLGLVGIAFGVLGMLLKLAIPVLLLAGVGYVALRVLSPETAKRLRDATRGSGL